MCSASSTRPCLASRPGTRGPYPGQTGASDTPPALAGRPPPIRQSGGSCRVGDRRGGAADRLGGGRKSCKCGSPGSLKPAEERPPCAQTHPGLLLPLPRARGSRARVLLGNNLPTALLASREPAENVY